MRWCGLLFALFIVGARTVSAEPIAVGTNLPLEWPSRFAASAWVGISPHQAIRASYARDGTLDLGLGGDGPEEGDVPPNFGHTTDLSVGWVYFPRRVLDGATFELGALVRFDRRRNMVDGQNVADDEEHTNLYGGRALVGWTWRMYNVFITANVGGGLGYERGPEKKFVGYDYTDPQHFDRTAITNVSRAAPSFESYLRIGLVFGQ